MKNTEIPAVITVCAIAAMVGMSGMVVSNHFEAKNSFVRPAVAATKQVESDKRELSEVELKNMSAYLGDASQNRYGFLLSSYDDVMNVDMRELFYNESGQKDDIINTFLNEYTGHSFSEYKKHGSFDDFICDNKSKPGDTNYRTITCLDGVMEDGVYTIDYSLDNSGVKDGTVVLDEISAGCFQFEANKLINE